MGSMQSGSDTHGAGGARGPLVEACDLKKSYGRAQAVRGISFAVRRGEVVGFLGPNGAGKSTTMKMLTGFLRPSAGAARVAGHDVAEQPMAVRRALGYLPENAPLYDEMMVIDFLRYVAALRNVPLPRRQARLREVCERCGLLGVLGKDIGQLSKGYRQRVGLAQALVHDPDLLLLDEPTSGLDPNQIIEIRALIRDLGRDKTVILSTHILPEVQATCDRVIIISEGRLVADGRPDVLSASAAHGAQQTVVRAAFRGRNEAPVDAATLRSLLHSLPGVHKVAPLDEAGALDGEATLGFAVHARGPGDLREAIFDAAVAQNLVLVEMQREGASLEDAFRRLTQGQGTGLDAGAAAEGDETSVASRAATAAHLAQAARSGSGRDGAGRGGLRA